MKFEDDWESVLLKFKGKFKCHHCKKFHDKKLLEKNYKIQGKNSNDGWTTGNGTLEFLVKEQINEIRNGSQFIQLKVMVKAFS